MTTPTVPTASGHEPRNSTHTALRENIEQHAREAQRWRVRSDYVLALWAIFVFVLSGWSVLVGIPSVCALLARGSPILLFGAWFGWCRSNYVKNECMKNLFSMLLIGIEEAPTAKAKTDMMRDIQKAIVNINSGNQKRYRTFGEGRKHKAPPGQDFSSRRSSLALVKAGCKS